MDIFANFIYKNTSSVCKSSLSSFCLKSADVASLHKKVKNDLKKTIDLLVFYRYTDTVKNFLRGPCLDKCQSFRELFIDATMRLPEMLSYATLSFGFVRKMKMCC